jgi:hypothetical protein
LGATPLEFHELGKGGDKVFHQAITSAKTANKFGAAVTVYPVEDYAKMRLFLADDGTVGFALDGNDIVSVFRHPQSTARHVTASILPLAVAQGGERLDCFDTELPRIYSMADFKAVARLAFDPKQQPKGWDNTTFAQFNGGHPDVVFMVYDPRYGRLYKAGDGEFVRDVNAGAKAQFDALNANRSFGEQPPAGARSVSDNR